MIGIVTRGKPHFFCTWTCHYGTLDISLQLTRHLMQFAREGSQSGSLAFRASW
jgi:hypothetical protein